MTMISILVEKADIYWPSALQHVGEVKISIPFLLQFSKRPERRSRGSGIMALQTALQLRMARENRRHQTSRGLSCCQAVLILQWLAESLALTLLRLGGSFNAYPMQRILRI